MKLFVPTSFILLFISILFNKGYSQEAGIACMGNGSMAVYEQKANVMQLFGPSYSAPSVMQMLLDSNIEVVSQREKGTAIWKHTLMRQSIKIATITDFVDNKKPYFIRSIKAFDSFSFNLDCPANVSLFNNKNAYKNNTAITAAMLIKTPSGTFFYNTYPLPKEVCYALLLKGNASLSGKRITCKMGASNLVIAGGPSYPECMVNSQNSLAEDISQLQERTRQWWLSFTHKRKNFAAIISQNVPYRDKLLQTIDDVSIIIKAQQSREGAVLAGYNYHLGYVRDQYGVSRCLLKLGYYKEAKQILKFYWNIWQVKKRLHNAQGIGIDAFHIHENDDVEITGYLIIQAFDYLAKTKDTEFIKTIFPMLEWAYKKQAHNLIKDMLPFNGDETYVAGGILPRSTLLDGSAEATLLFITGSEKLIGWIEKNKYWNLKSIGKARKILTTTKARYQQNFIENGKLLTNNPVRMKGEQYPMFRHGVCEVMGAPPCEFFGWTQKTDNNRYLCSVCFATKTLPKVTDEKFFLQSVSLTPYYIGATVLENSQINDFIKEVAVTYKATGNFPSRPDSTGISNIVGYDYGLFLYSLNKINDPLRVEIYIKMMNVLDDTGSWVEYYQNNKPSGTRCRPWESGINLEAAISFAENYP